jgi:hypothetical protein
MCCLFFFDIQILITPLVSSISSFNNHLYTGVKNVKNSAWTKYRNA